MDNRSQLEAFGLFSLRPPRYTSYPAAPHFSARIGKVQQQDWLKTLPEDEPVSVYVHIPFCRRLCWFCACRTQGARTDAPIARYLSFLHAEIEALGRILPNGRLPLSRLHWGGGTPTILSPAQISDLTIKLRKVFDFTDDAEFSVEVDPNEIDEARLLALSKAGMTRASIGVQDFDKGIQQTIGREQSFADTSTAVQGLRAAGVQSVNADLVYGLPNQTPSSLKRTIKRLLWLHPDRVALYGYAHVPAMARRQVMIPQASLPDAVRRLDLFEAAQEVFINAGYEQLGIDHFALPNDRLAVAAREGRLRRNFQGYTDDGAATLIGLGASSISEFPQGYAQNAASTAAYQRCIEEDGFAVARGHAFSQDDLDRKAVMSQIMCDFGFAMDTSVPDLIIADANMIALKYAGAVEIAGGRFQIKPAAHVLARIIAQEFDAYRTETAPMSGAI